MRVRTAAALVAMSIVSGAAAQIPEQYPRPLIHTPADHPADRVIILSVDGMRAVNLANFVSSHPQSALAELSKRGVTYTNAHIPWPDTAAGMIAVVTGGSPISTGIVSAQGYDRSLSREGAGCERGAAEVNLNSGDIEIQQAAAQCKAVQAHQLMRVNSILDLVHAAGGRTAWADSNAAYLDLLRGSSGKALDQAFVATSAPAPTDPVSVAESLDSKSVEAMVGWIRSGSDMPRLSGLSLLGYDAAQRSLPLSQTATEGAASGVKRLPLERIDAQVQRIVTALKTAGLFDSTWIIVTARHGSLGDTANLRVVDSLRVEQVAKTAAGSELGRVVVGTAGMIWLRNPAKIDAIVRAYRAKMLELGIGAIYSGEKLRLIMNTAKEDTRMPDIILEPQAGVVWSKGGQWPAHVGGFSEDENHVAMLISGRQLTGRVDKTPVPTGQVAPLILRILGMEKLDLQALHQEHVPALPGIF